MELQPEEATVLLDDGSTKVVSVEDLKIGIELLLR